MDGVIFQVTYPQSGVEPDLFATQGEALIAIARAIAGQTCLRLAVVKAVAFNTRMGGGKAYRQACVNPEVIRSIQALLETYKITPISGSLPTKETVSAQLTLGLD